MYSGNNRDTSAVLYLCKYIVSYLHKDGGWAGVLFDMEK